MNALDSLPGVRASDAERDHVAQILQTAAADGRLSPEEAGERLAAASAARLRDELARLIADLPEGQWGGGQQPLAFLALGVLAQARRARWVQWRRPWWLRTRR